MNLSQNTTWPWRAMMSLWQMCIPQNSSRQGAWGGSLQPHCSDNLVYWPHAGTIISFDIVSKFTWFLPEEFPTACSYHNLSTVVIYSRNNYLLTSFSPKMILLASVHPKYKMPLPWHYNEAPLTHDTWWVSFHCCDKVTYNKLLSTREKVSENFISSRMDL